MNGRLDEGDGGEDGPGITITADTPATLPWTYKIAAGRRCMYAKSRSPAKIHVQGILPSWMAENYDGKLMGHAESYLRDMRQVQHTQVTML